MASAYASEVEIARPADEVWSILVDLPSYREWNPFTPRIRTTALEEGRWVVIQAWVGWLPFVVLDRIVKVDPGQTIAWAVEAGPFLQGRREQQVLPLDGGRCRYTTREEFHGLLTPLLDALVGKALALATARMAESLRTRAEAP